MALLGGVGRRLTEDMILDAERFVVPRATKRMGRILRSTARDINPDNALRAAGTAGLIGNAESYAYGGMQSGWAPAGRAASRAVRTGAVAGMATLGLAGAAGYGFDRMVRNNDKPKDTPLMDAFFAITMGNPQADRAIFGSDLTASQFFTPMPGPFGTLQRLSMVNSQTFGDTRYMRNGALNQDAAIQAAGTIMGNDRTTDNPYLYAGSMPGIRYQPSSRRPSNMVDGSMVFGMHNMRR